MLRHIHAAVFRNSRRFTITLERYVRGSAVKETEAHEPSHSSESIDASSVIRFNYGIKRPTIAREVVEPPVHQRVASLFGHPRLPPRDQDVQQERPKFDDIEEDDQQEMGAAELVKREEDFDDQPKRGPRPGQFTPLDRPVPASERKPRSFLRSYTLTTMVNDSELLRNLVDIGVNLSKFDNMYNVADWLVKLDWDNDIKPVLRFLNESGGVPLEELGSFVTANPWILQQALDDLRIRIGYLESKKFSKEAITRIITKAKYWLNFHVKTIDKRLGFLQTTFQLSGDEVRFVVSHTPKIITFGSGYTQLLMLSFKEEMGFNTGEMRQLLINDPRLWVAYKTTLLKTFDYVHNTMKLSHKEILAWPNILRVQPHAVRQRHKYLKKVGRAQFDPEKPNYVSLEALVKLSDHEFAVQLAKTSIDEYNKFLKQF